MAFDFRRCLIRFGGARGRQAKKAQEHTPIMSHAKQKPRVLTRGFVRPAVACALYREAGRLGLLTGALGGYRGMPRSDRA